MSTIYVVINVIGGIVDEVSTFSQKNDAEQRYRELVFENSAWLRLDIMTAFSDHPKDFDDVWQKDSTEYLYDKEEDLYYPVSTDDHDVFLHETILNGE